jgi:hypothetical protein
VAPAGSPRRFDRATIASDRGTLTVEFVGGPGYLASDKCSTDYEPWLAVVGDELDVVVVQVMHPEQATMAPNEGCDAVGYGWTFHLRLPAPFDGTKVKDLAIGRFIDIDPPPATSAPSTPSTPDPTQAAGSTRPIILDLFERSFGPPYPPERPEGQLSAISGARVSPDGMTLTIDFVGGSPYDAAHPNACSTDYVPWVAVRGDQLDVAVVRIPHPFPQSSEPVFCTLVGHAWRFHLALPEPSHGMRIKDLSSGQLVADPVWP